MLTSVDWGASNNSIRVFLGKGNGQFAAPITTLTADMDLVSFAVGDFNNDGRLDILQVPAAGQVWNTFSMFLGNGDGTFKTPISSAAGNNSRCTQVGDFNGDGKLDVVTWGSQTDAIHLGNGDGTFQPPQNTSLPPAFGCPAVADLNGDGKLDIAEGNSIGTVGVVYGNGDGTFGNLVDYKISPVAEAEVFVGDFNGDGKPDLVAEDTIHHVLYILINKGNGVFAPPVGYLQGEGYPARIFPDLLSNGRSDVLLQSGIGGTTLIGLSQSGGTLALPRAYTAYGTFVADAAALNVTGNSRPDLLVLTQQDAQPRGEVSLFKAGPRGTLSNAVALLTRTFNPLAIAVADVNGDGYPDIVISDVFHVTVFLGTATNKFQLPMNFYVPVGANSIAVGDFNGDGKLDLALNNAFTGYPGIMLFGNGDGTFLQGQNLPVGIDSLAAADFNHDGKLDLAVSTANGTGVMLGRGDGTFPQLLNIQPGQGGALLVADFNGDGLPDVAGFGNTDPQTGAVSVYLGNGDGTFRPAKNSLNNVPYNVSRAAAADFNGDGKIDLAVTGYGEFFVLSGNGDGTFAQPLAYEAGARPETIVAADFNGDGLPDLAVVNWGDNTVHIWLNTP
jgi:hypothetical protein